MNNTQISFLAAIVATGCAHAPYQKQNVAAPETKVQHVAAFLMRHAPLQEGKYCASVETTNGILMFCYEPEGKPNNYADDNFHLGFSSENYMFVDNGVDESLDYILLVGAENPTKITEVREDYKEQFKAEYEYTINKLYKAAVQQERVAKLLPWMVP